MKERTVQIRKFFAEAWWDWFRWLVLLYLATAGLTTLILWWKFHEYPFIVYFIEFFACLAVSWVFMFRKRPIRREFKGDD